MKQNNENRKVFCPAAYTGLQVTPEKDIKPCCVFSGSWGNLNKKNSTIEKIYFGEKANTTRLKMEKGEWPDECIECKHEERTLSTSLRLDYQMPSEDIQLKKEEFFLENIEIFISNLCNMDCVMCYSGCSTKLTDTIKKMPDNVSSIIQTKLYEHASLNINEIKSILTKITENGEVRIIGGEPFASPLINDILNYWIDNKLNTTLNITSNIFLLNETFVKKLSLIKNLFITASVDGVGLTYQWIRGAPWNKIKENLELIKEYKLPYQISPTIGLYNLWHTSEMIDYFNEHGYRYKINNILVYPEYLEPLNLSQEVRSKIKESFVSNPPYKIQNILTKERNKNFKNNLNGAIKWINYFNEIRGINIFEISEGKLDKKMFI